MTSFLNNLTGKKTWYQWCGTRFRSGIHKAFFTRTFQSQ